MGTLQVESPQSITDIRVSRTLIEELALKILFFSGEMSLLDLANRMCLSLAIVEQTFQFFRREQLCEVKGMARGTHVISLSSIGKQRAGELLAISYYAGPAPVSLEEYIERVRAQSVQQVQVQPGDLTRAFEKMVLSGDLVARLGTAVVSGTSIFLYGPPGTGKTTLAFNIPSIFDDFILIPHAIEVDHQIISVYDPGVHTRVQETLPDDWDRRWVPCRRPRVMTGGEFSGEMLDLQFNAASRLLTAPLQLKANNGVFVLDDFGRQRMRPEELLNRWMTPLDRRIDFLTLPGGKKFEIPFDVLVVFSTNLDPRTLADDAFLRRVPNKINVSHATPEQFVEIFLKECTARTVACDANIAEYAVQFITNEMRQPLSHCTARDLLNQICWSASYRGVEPVMNRGTLERACRDYFLPTRTV